MPKHRPTRNYLPMLGHIPQPRHAGGLEAYVGVEATGDGAMDYGLLLLAEQRAQPLLRLDRATNAPVDVVQKADDRGLLISWWDRDVNVLKPRGVDVSLDVADPLGCRHELVDHHSRLKQVVRKP